MNTIKVVLNSNFFALNWFDVFIYSLVELYLLNYISSKIRETSPFQIKNTIIPIF